MQPSQLADVRPVIEPNPWPLRAFQDLPRGVGRALKYPPQAYPKRRALAPAQEGPNACLLTNPHTRASDDVAVSFAHILLEPD